jgi:hypothetical protein
MPAMQILLRIVFGGMAILIAMTSSRLNADDGLSLPDREHFHLFLLAGQSNMAGRGKVEAEDRAVHPRVFTLDKNNSWVPAVDPIHFDKSVAGVGLGRTFGITVAEGNPEIVVGLIPCAVGGSPISSWEPGGYHDQTKSHPYDDARARVQVALKQGTLQGILWHQGESDSNDSKAAVYEEKLHALIARFREEFDSPQVPFLVGQLGVFEERPWNDARRLVDAAHRSLPEKVAVTAFVPSTGLRPNDDLVHFDAPSLREFGKRYAAAYAKLVQERRQAAE